VANKQERVRESTLYRLDRHVGFNARVEPYWYSFERMKASMGFFERWRERRRMKRVCAAIREGLTRRGAEASDWETRSGQCVCNLRVARTGLLAELQELLRQEVPDGVEQWAHVMAQKDRASFLLPVAFEEPFGVGPGSVTSAPRILEELADINRRLRIDEKFALAKAKKMDYIDATEKDISLYESKFGTIEGFWAKFSYVLLRKLADTSRESGLPALFA